MSVSITSTYAGEFSGKYIAAALLSASTLDRGGITIMPNVKYKSVLKKAATDGIVKDATCDFQTGDGTLTLTEAILQPEEFQVNLDICKKDLHSDWMAAEMGFSAFDELPKSFADFVIAHVASKVADSTETNIWEGDTANNGQFDGFVKKLKADATVSDITGTAVTSSNVIAELGKVVDALPSAVYSMPNVHLYVSSNIARAYIRALGGFGSSGLGAAGIGNQGTMFYGENDRQNGGGLSFEGIPLFVSSGFGDNTAIATYKENLVFGTGLLDDRNVVKVIDMADLDGSSNVRVVMRFTAGVQHIWGSDIVLYEEGV